MPTLHIVGGGIAGLTLAASLRADVGRIIVHEQGRPPGEREVDTAFGLWPPAMKALARIGLAQTVSERSARLTGATVSAADGRALRSIRGQHIPMIGRVTLREALPEHVEWRDAGGLAGVLPNGTTATGCSVANVRPGSPHPPEGRSTSY